MEQRQPMVLETRMNSMAAATTITVWQSTLLVMDRQPPWKKFPDWAIHLQLRLPAMAAPCVFHAEPVECLWTIPLKRPTSLFLRVLSMVTSWCARIPPVSLLEGSSFAGVRFGTNVSRMFTFPYLGFHLSLILLPSFLF